MRQSRARRFGSLVALLALVGGCATPRGRAPVPTEKLLLPLPTHVLAGSTIPLFPSTHFTVDSATGWASQLGDRRVVLDRIDSILAAGSKERAPEVEWVKVDVVRKAAREAPGLLTNPDQLATSTLRTHALTTIPEPLRAQLRQLVAVAAGGRYALIPVSVAFTHGGTAEEPQNYADFTIVLTDVRVGAVSWSNTMRGSGRTPWEALATAVRIMFP